MGHHIAVIGIGCIYPGAKSPLELWENVLTRRQQFRQMPDVRLPSSDYYDPDPTVPDKTYQNKASVIDGYVFDWQDKRIPKKTYESTDIVHWLALDTALKAIADSGYSKEKLPRDTTGVIIGNTLTGEFTRSNQMLLRYPYVRKVLWASLQQNGLAEHFDEIEPILEKYYKSVFAPVTEDSLAGGLANTIAGRICNYLDLHGGGYIVDGACSSSLLAICTAANYLESGQMDVAIAGGVDISLDTFELIGFAKTGALTPDEMRVYDKKGNGFLPGEGCGIVVLKRWEDAQRDGDSVYAILKGWGISSDGKGGITAPSDIGQATALRRAYTKANFNTDHLDFIEGHGTGTTVGDKTELAGIALALNHDKTLPPRRCGVTSFKSIVGHTKAAAGIGGFIKTVVALNRRVLPPTAGLKEPNPIFQEAAITLYPILHGQVRNPGSQMFAGVSAMGFGGINSHVLLQSGDAPLAKLQPSIEERKLLVSNQSSEVFFFSASSPEDMAAKIAQAIADSSGISYGELTDYAYHINFGVDFEQPFRAAVVANSPADLEGKLTLLKASLSQPPTDRFGFLENNSIAFGRNRKSDSLRLGALYPGQGSQRLNMAYKLVERFDWARELFDWAIAVFQEEGIEGIREAMFPPVDRLQDTAQDHTWKERLKQTQIAQPAIVLTSLLWQNYLERLGLQFCAATGHSLGELMAFHTAGVYDAETLLRFAAYRGKVMSENASGAMASLICTKERAADYVQKVLGYAVIANINTPEQVVVSGDRESIQRLIKLAGEDGIQAVELPVAAAFHSQLVADAAAALRECPLLKQESANHQIKPQFKLVSSVTGNIVEAGFDLQTYFSEQAVYPVNFVKAIATLQQECDLLIEVGTGRVLTGLASQITNDIKCFPVEASAEDDFSFNLMLANAFVRGANLHIAEIYRNRLIRPFVPTQQKDFLVNPLERPLPDVIAGRPSSNGLANLSSLVNIQNVNLQHYLAERGDFIRDIILTDLKYLKNIPAPPMPPVAIAVNNSPVSDLVMALAAETTGFPKEAMKLEFRLLDHLNLDSIKAGSFMSELSKQFNLQGKLEPSAFANATLAEIIDAITAHQQNQGVPSEAEPEAEISAPSWVRSFAAKLVIEPLSEENGQPKRHLAPMTIACTPSHKESALALCEHLGATAQVSLWDASSSSELDQMISQSDRLLILMPDASDSSILTETVAMLATIAQSTANKPLELGFIQWGDGYFSRSHSEQLHSIFSAMSFAASLHLERPTAKIRVVECDRFLALERLLEKISHEFATNDAYSVSGYDREGVRRKMVYDLADRQITPRNISLSSEDVVLVTGGAKGITAECALAFAQKYRCKMALVGSSPHSTEIEKILHRYIDANLTAQYFPCDISDRPAVEGLISQITSKLGAPTVVIHGAGLNQPRRAEQVPAAEAYQEIAPKLLGAINLIAAIAAPPPRYFIALTSIIGVTGMVGNSWYAFANEAVDLLLRNLAKHSSTETIALAYSVWSEVGMGARMGSIKTLSHIGISAIPPTQGIAEFLRWIENRASDAQVVIAAKLGGLDTWPRQSLVLPPAHRYLEELVYCEPGVELIVRASLSRQHDKYADDHNFNGSLLFPTVFGLEAMTQAATYLTGTTNLKSVTFENISLQKPIVIPQQGAVKIQIRALVEGEKIFASISTAESNYKLDCFAAEIRLNPVTNTLTPLHHAGEKAAIDEDRSPLPLDPQTDLYSWLLFQGATFQNIDKIYELNADAALFSTKNFTTDTSEICFSPAKCTAFALGSPLLRDVLLQTAQLALTHNVYLPISIEKWEIYHIQPGTGQKFAQVQRQLQNNNKFDVLSETFNILLKSSDFQIFEKISGYQVKALKPTPEYPTAAEIADGTVVANKIIQGFHSFQHLYEPTIDVIAYKHSALFNTIDIAKRHTIEQQVFQNLYLPTNNMSLAPGGHEIYWTEDGKPCLSNTELHISISHSRSLLLMTVGREPQGCDIEFVEGRPQEQWLDLLGHQYSPLLDQLKSVDDGLDVAATRLWCVKESGFKAAGTLPENISIHHISQAGVVFNALVNGQAFYILTFPVMIWPKNQAIVAIKVRPVTSSLPSLAVPIVSPQAALQFERQTKKYVQQFHTTFKDCNSFFGKSYFTKFPQWMGQIRELLLKPISGDLLNDFRSSEYGMVTNQSVLRIFNEAEALDNLIGKIWLTDESNSAGSVIGMGFEWFKENHDGTFIKLAESKNVATWVKNEGYGIVKISPFPQYLFNFLDEFTLLHEGAYTPVDGSYLSLADLGDLQYESPAMPLPAIILNQKTYHTSIYDGNSVGNLYYSNYYDWQAKNMERFIYQLVPEIFPARGKVGEYICLDSQVNHLQEAMPFEEIEVVMYLEQLYTNGIKFYFEYFSLGDGTSRRKLAYGSNTLIWAKRQNENSQPIACPLPAKIQSHLMKLL